MRHFVVFLCCVAYAMSVPVAEKIAFYARMSGDKTVCVGDTVVFNSVLLNERGGQSSQHGYNANTGHFVCPISGVYSFSAHINLNGGGHMDFAMFKNGQPMMYFVAGNWIGDGGTIETYCQMGEAVYIKVHEQHRPERVRSIYSGFSGRLVFLK